MDSCVKALKEVVPAAEKAGVILQMELLNSKVNHADYMCDNSIWGVELVKRVGSDNFKLLYDIYHMQIMEGDVIRTIEANHKYYGHYHTGGNPGRHELDATQELNYARDLAGDRGRRFQGLHGPRVPARARPDDQPGRGRFAVHRLKPRLTMELVNLGRSGVKVSKICLGCMTYGSSRWRPWVLDEEASRPFFKRAWEAGINFFDTADMYRRGERGSARTRPARPGDPPRAGRRRDQGLQPDGSDGQRTWSLAQAYHHSIDASLKRLRLDYVDLYQIHRFDPTTPVEETLDALDAVVRAGKALYLGASSMFAWQMAKMLHASDRLGLARFATMQNHYNLVYREEEREMIPLCLDEGIGLIPWSPLARGFLAGNRNRRDHGETSRAKTDEYAHKLYWEDADFAVVDRVERSLRRGAYRTAESRWPGLCSSQASSRQSSGPRSRVTSTTRSPRWT